MSRPWTDDLDAQLRKLLVDDGLTAKQASPILGRPSGGINVRAKKLGIVRLARQDWDEASVTQLRELFAARRTAEAMAHEMRRPIGSINWKLDDLGLKRGRGARTIGLRPAPAPRTKPVAADAAPARSRAPPTQRLAIARAGLRAASEADRARGRTASAEATRAADAILAEAKRAEREAKRSAGAEARAVRVAAAKAAAAEAERLERAEVARRRQAASAEARLRRERERAEERRLADVVKAEKRERVERELRIAQAKAVAEGRGGNVAGGVVRRVLAKRTAEAATRDAALAVRDSAAEAIARFLRERGATRVVLDPVDEVVAGLRRKGYAIVREGDAWLVDGRHRLLGFAELRDFASRRGVAVSAFAQAAE